MVEWNGYSIGAIILVMAAIIAIIAGIVMFENDTTPTSGTKWWTWLLIIGGIILLIIGVILGFVGRSRPGMDARTMMTHHHMSATHGLPGHPYASHNPYYPYGSSTYSHHDTAASYGVPSSYPGYA